MPVILLTNHYDERPAAIVKEAVPEGFTLMMLEKECQQELVEKAPLADYFLVSGRLQISQEVISAATRLKMIQRTGVGIDMLDLKAIGERNIPVYVNAGINAASVAEHAVLHILAALRRLVIVDASIRNGIWAKRDNGLQTNELSGKTVGLVGAGNIGRHTAKMLSGFDCRIIYYDMYRLSPEMEQELGITYQPFEQLLEQSDIISLHCPLTDETRGIINKETIAKMKDGVILVNTARGGLIVEQDLREALDSKKVKAAGLDVFSTEPPAKDNPLITCQNVTLSPHMGGVTYESFKDMMAGAMQNMVIYEQGRMAELESKRLKTE
jgi:D-3-phosphoglycerate dehydrogenase